jgi:multidrug transporter EmrE-like cation transporter
MPALILLVLGGSILTVGDVIFKFYAETPKSFLYVLGLIVYLLGLIFLVQTYKTENIAIASAIFVIINIVTLLFVSKFYFGEQPSLWQVVGVIIAIVAILLMELGK